MKLIKGLKVWELIKVMEFVEYTIDELSLEIKTGKTPPTSSIEYFDGDIVWLTPGLPSFH